MLYEKAPGGRLHCFLCAHHCRIARGKSGICGVREHREDRLVTRAYGEAVAANVDPIEKKPLYHFLPDTRAFSVGAMGCNFQCGFCQNWEISQPGKRGEPTRAGIRLSPGEIVVQAREQECQSIAYTYTEPTIFFEYAYDTAKIAKNSGLQNVFVTNGYLTREALETVAPLLDACNVDLKSLSDRFYRNICRARLQPVLDSIRVMRDLGIWVEVTTLVVPGGNDAPAELSAIARFLAGVDPGIPWHISRFHPYYKYVEAPATPIETLRRAYSLGKRAGLRHVYIGNTPGEASDTLCPSCGTPVIRRHGIDSTYTLLENSACPACSEKIAGVFRTRK